MKIYCIPFAFALLLLQACSPAKQLPHSRPELYDHHVHFLSPGFIDFWKKMGIPFSKADHFYSDVDSIFSLSGCGKMKLISMAYVFSSEEFGGGSKDAIDRMRTENDYLAALKSKYPDRISAYYGIDPLQANAVDEIQRCHKTLKLDGIKLHGNASQIYLTEPVHLQKVKMVFRYASDHKIPVLLHFDNSHPKFGERDVRLLADSVLHGLAFVDLQIAHFGTSGGFTQKTKNVLDAFIGLFNEKHPISTQNIKFDISAVCLDKDSDGVSKLTEAEFLELAGYVRKLGLNRIVFGTDYPLYNAREYLAILKTKLSLTDKEIAQLLADK